MKNNNEDLFAGAELMALSMSDLCGVISKMLKIESNKQRNKILLKYHKKIEKIIESAKKEELI